ncbi:hypothetical protein PRZ48_013197 [Zasmidium cellare]|uniref:Uncharacterized protein n=1 Tax=Zasmidium cellare TaxID=395010 RepID=A0ABR0E3M7_ZASCE|nr:hypothetical protein PRZ48_013197 [Zasmidium cellare]
MLTYDPPTYLFVAVNDLGDKAEGWELAQRLVIRSESEKSPRRLREIREPVSRDGFTYEDVEDSPRVANTHEGESAVQENPTPNQSTAWTFLPVDPATAQPTKSARHNIRAHVAKRQHRQRREQEAKLNRTVSENEVLTRKRNGPSPSSTSPPILLSSRRSSSSRIDTLPPQPLSLLLNPSDPADQLHLYARLLSTTVPQIWTCYLHQERAHGLLFHAQFARFKG